MLRRPPRRTVASYNGANQPRSIAFVFVEAVSADWGNAVELPSVVSREFSLQSLSAISALPPCLASHGGCLSRCATCPSPHSWRLLRS